MHFSHALDIIGVEVFLGVEVHLRKSLCFKLTCGGGESVARLASLLAFMLFHRKKICKLDRFPSSAGNLYR